MFVKICGLRTPEHVQSAIDAGADAVGFVLTPDSPRHIAADAAKSLVDVVDGRVMTVGVFRDETVDEIEQLAAASGVSAIQVHGTRSRAEISKLAQWSRVLIRAVSFDDPSLQEGSYGEDHLLIDAPRPGSGEAWDYAAMASVSGPGMQGSGLESRWLLAGGLTPSNVVEAIAAAQPWGVDVSSGVETAPGEKSSELIRAFVAAAKG